MEKEAQQEFLVPLKMISGSQTWSRACKWIPARNLRDEGTSELRGLFQSLADATRKEAMNTLGQGEQERASDRCHAWGIALWYCTENRFRLGWRQGSDHSRSGWRYRRLLLWSFKSRINSHVCLARKLIACPAARRIKLTFEPMRLGRRDFFLPISFKPLPRSLAEGF